MPLRRLLAALMALIFSLCLPAACAEAPTEEVAAMRPVLESLLNASLCLERDYAAADPAFFWTALGELALETCRDDPLCEVADGELRVPRQKMRELATAAFSEYRDLLPLPAGEFFVRYDEAWDAYFVSLGSDCCADAELISGRVQPNDTVSVELEASSGGKSYMVRAVLARNRYLDGVTDPVYLYSVVSTQIDPGVEQRRERQVEIGGAPQPAGEVRFVGAGGCALWYCDEQVQAFTDAEGDHFRPVDGADAELTIAPAESEEAALAHLSAASERQEETLASGLTCQWIEIEWGERIERRYLIRGESGLWTATLTGPAGSEALDWLNAALETMELADA